jgi:hypothetical protein
MVFNDCFLNLWGKGKKEFEEFEKQKQKKECWISGSLRASR